MRGLLAHQTRSNHARGNTTQIDANASIAGGTGGKTISFVIAYGHERSI
jgi:hypothetical protein